VVKGSAQEYSTKEWWQAVRTVLGGQYPNLRVQAAGFTEKLWRLTAALRERVWLSPLLPRFHLRVFLWHTEVIEGHQFTWLRNGPMFLGKAEYEEVVSPGFEMRMWSCQSQI